MAVVPEIGKGWNERTGIRPDGFSRLLRTWGREEPFLNKTRHIDDDLNEQGWRMACWNCFRSFFYLEEKYRPPENRKPLSPAEWRITRNDAADWPKPVIAVAWWNGVDDPSLPPSEMWVELNRPGEPDYHFGPTVLIVEHFKPILVDLLSLHRTKCVGDS